MTGALQSAVAARVPGAAALGLLVPPSAPLVPGSALAEPLAAAIGAPLPMPRYVDVAGARFTHRVSCCLMVEVPGGSLCTSCPRRPPADRQARLEQAARRF